MIEPADSPPLARFSNPNEALSHLDAEHAGALIASAADVALIMDRDGVILDTAFSEVDLSSKIGGDWIGHLLTAETVIRMPEVDIEVPLAEFYAGIDFTAAS